MMDVELRDLLGRMESAMGDAPPEWPVLREIIASAVAAEARSHWVSDTVVYYYAPEADALYRAIKELREMLAGDTEGVG